MGFARRFLGILITGCLAQTVVTAVSLAQPTRVQWALDYAREEVGHGWLSAAAKDKVRVVLDQSLGLYGQAGLPTQLTWSDSPDVVEKFLVQAKALAVALSSPGGVVDTVEIVPRDLLSTGRADAFASIQSTFTTVSPFVFLLSEPVPKGTPRLTISEARQSHQIAAAWSKLPAQRPVRYALLKNGAYLGLVPDNAEAVRRQAVGAFLEHTEILIERIRSRDQGAATKLVQETDALFGGLERSNLVTDGLKSYELAWRYQLRSPLLRGALTPTIAEDIRLFRTGLRNASEGKGTTTVTVSASNGDGASVMFAKLPDAERGLFTDFGVTTAVRNVESATYEFRTYRGGRQTGKTVWTCTGDAVWVPIKE